MFVCGVRRAGCSAKGSYTPYSLGYKRRPEFGAAPTSEFFFFLSFFFFISDVSVSPLQGHDGDDSGFMVRASAPGFQGLRAPYEFRILGAECRPEGMDLVCSCAEVLINNDSCSSSAGL